MNTLNGYSKSTLTDSNVLSAAGGHLPFVAGRLWRSWTSVTIEEANVVWYIKVEIPGYSKPSSMLIYGSYNNNDDQGLVEFSGFSKGYIYRNINQNSGNVTAVCMSSVYDSTTKKWTFWIKMRPINNSSDYYTPDSSATYKIYFSESYTITATATTTDPGVEWQNTTINLVINNAALIGTATTATAAISANKIPVTQNTNTDVEWPIVWSNQNNTNSATANQLYKSYNNLSYNPAKQRLTANYGNFSKGITISDRFNYGLAFWGKSEFNFTGAIVIKLPTGWSNSMNTYEIDIFECSSTKGHSKIYISGYNYSGTSSWYYPSYHVVGNYTKPVRLGYYTLSDGTVKCCIILGETTSVWNYTYVYLTGVYSGYSNSTLWRSGYSIELVTNKTTFDNTYLGLYTLSKSPTITGNLTIESGNSPSLTFQCGTFEDTKDDWSIINEGGGLKIRDLNSTINSGNWVDVITLGPGDANPTVTFGRNILPLSANTLSLGNSTYKWSNVYATNFNGALKGNADSSNRLNEYYGLDRSKDSEIIAPKNMPLGMFIRFKKGTGANHNSYWNTVVAMNAFTGGSSTGAGYRHEFLFSDSSDHSDGTFYVRNGVDDTWNPWRKVLTDYNWTSTIDLSSYATKTYVDTAIANAQLGGSSPDLELYFRPTYVNGAGFSFASNTSGNAFTIYAPTSAGASNQVLISTGSTPSWTNQSNLSVGNSTKLNGQAASYYATASALDNYFKKTGGTISGTLAVSNTATFYSAVRITNSFNPYINFVSSSTSEMVSSIYGVTDYNTTSKVYPYGARIFFRLYSVSATNTANATISTSGYEDYVLGPCDAGLTSRVAYNIYTEKNKQSVVSLIGTTDNSDLPLVFTNGVNTSTTSEVFKQLYVNTNKLILAFNPNSKTLKIRGTTTSGILQLGSNNASVDLSCSGRGILNTPKGFRAVSSDTTPGSLTLGSSSGSTQLQYNIDTNDSGVVVKLPAKEGVLALLSDVEEGLNSVNVHSRYTKKTRTSYNGSPTYFQHIDIYKIPLRNSGDITAYLNLFELKVESNGLGSGYLYERAGSTLTAIKLDAAFIPQYTVHIPIGCLGYLTIDTYGKIQVRMTTDPTQGGLTHTGIQYLSYYYITTY